MRDAQPGDEFVFRWKAGRWPFKRLQSKTFRIGELSGEGNTTKVFRLYENADQVLRVPRDWDYFETENLPTTNFLNAMAYYHGKLQRLGVPIVELFEHVPNLYMLVTPIDGPTLEQFIQDPFAFSLKERGKMYRSLAAFFRATARIYHIVDINYGSLMYHKTRGWLLADWRGPVGTLKLSLGNLDADDFFQQAHAQTEVSVPNGMSAADIHSRTEAFHDFVESIVFNERHYLFDRTPRQPVMLEKFGISCAEFLTEPL